MCIFLTAYSDRSSDRCQQCSCPNLFRISTYETSRKCCNQRTYRVAKSFRFHTYKKHGGVGGVMVNRYRPSASLTRHVTPAVAHNLEGFPLPTPVALDSYGASGLR